MTSDGQGNTYTWNARNQLIGISGAGGTASFTYDPMGRRSSKTINGATTGFLYDGANLIQEQHQWGEPTANLLTGLSIDETVARCPIHGGASAAEVMITDALGSTIALTDHSGEVKTTYAYDTYGGTVTSGVPSTNPIQYTGRENGGINGLYYYRARYYSTHAQRFISEDPIGLDGGVNAHAYVGGSLLMFTDPLGLRTEVVVWNGVGTGSSAFGHVSTTINGQNFSWGPGGWDSTHGSADAYNQRQESFRGGTGFTLDLTPQEEMEVAQCMRSRRGYYGVIANNCAAPVQSCLPARLRLNNGRTLPGELAKDLANSPGLTSTISYPAPPSARPTPKFSFGF